MFGRGTHVFQAVCRVKFPGGRNSLQYFCDEEYVMFKDFSLCSHVIAACHDNGDLRSFLENCTKSRLNQIWQLYNGSGRKGVTKRKRSRVTTVRQCLQQNCSPAHSSATLDSPSQQPTGFEQGTSKTFEQYQSKSYSSY